MRVANQDNFIVGIITKECGNKRKILPSDEKEGPPD